MKMMLMLVTLSYANIVSANSEDVYKQWAKQAMRTKTVQECSVKKEEFFQCQEKLSSSEREKLCGNFSELNKLAEGDTAKMFRLISEACLKFAKFH